MNILPQIPLTWSKEHLHKLAWLEKKAISYLDEFIDRQISKGEDTSVALERFPGSVAHAHEYNLRDYIGRSVGPLFDFLSDRPYLWSVKWNGFVTKCADRESIYEMAALMDENVKKRGRQGTNVHFLMASTLLRYPEVFKAVDMAEDSPDEYVEFEFLLTIIDGVILPKSITSKIGSGVVKALAITPMPTSIESAPSDQSGGSENGNVGSGSQDEQIEGTGYVVHICESYGFLRYRDRKNERQIRVFFDSRAMGLSTSTALSDHVKMGDRLAFKAVINQGGPEAGKWSAVSVRNESTIPATKSKNSASAAGDGGEPKLAPPMAKSSGKSVSGSEASSKNARRRRRRTRATNAYVSVTDKDSSSQQSKETVIDVGSHGDHLKQQPASKIDHVDVGVQTDVTDEQLLLRLLRSFPYLLDEYEIVRRQ